MPNFIFGMYNTLGDMDEKTENYWRILQTNLDWIKYSDAKATGLLTVYGVLVTVAFSNKDAFVGILHSRPLVFILTLTVVVSLLAIFYGFRCISPRLKTPSHVSMIFFGSIVSNFKSMEDYREFSHKLLNSKVGIDDELARQIYINATIAAAKFRDVSLSIRYFIISFLLLMLEIFIFLIEN